MAQDIDIIVFAQGSMAYCEDYIENQLDKVVLSNPLFSALAVKEALVEKGLLSSSN